MHSPRLSPQPACLDALLPPWPRITLPPRSPSPLALCSHALQEVKKLEGLVSRQELAALHADVDGLRREMLRVEDELKRTQARAHEHLPSVGFVAAAVASLPPAMREHCAQVCRCPPCRKSLRQRRRLPPPRARRRMRPPTASVPRRQPRRRPRRWVAQRGAAGRAPCCSCPSRRPGSALTPTPPLLPLPQAVEVTNLKQQLFAAQRAARDAQGALYSTSRDNEELLARLALLNETVLALERWAAGAGRAGCWGCQGACRHGRLRLHAGMADITGGLVLSPNCGPATAPPLQHACRPAARAEPCEEARQAL